MSVSAQNVIEALKGSPYIPQVHRWTHSQPCLAVTLIGSGNVMDLASRLVEGGLYTDYLAELGRTMRIDMTSIGMGVGVGFTVYWPHLLLEPEQILALNGSLEYENEFTHYV